MSATYIFTNADEILADDAIRADIRGMVGSNLDALRFLYSATLKALAKNSDSKSWKTKRSREKSQYISGVLKLLETLAVSKSYGGEAEIGVTPKTYRAYCTTVMLSLKYNVSLEIARQYSAPKYFSQAQNLISENPLKYKDNDDPDNRDLQWSNALEEAKTSVVEDQEEASRRREDRKIKARIDNDKRELPPIDYEDEDEFGDRIEGTLIYYFIELDLLSRCPSLNDRPMIKEVNEVVKKIHRLQTKSSRKKVVAV